MFILITKDQRTSVCQFWWLLSIQLYQYTYLHIGFSKLLAIMRENFQSRLVCPFVHLSQNYTRHCLSLSRPYYSPKILSLALNIIICPFTSTHIH